GCRRAAQPLAGAGGAGHEERARDPYRFAGGRTPQTPARARAQRACGADGGRRRLPARHDGRVLRPGDALAFRSRRAGPALRGARHLRLLRASRAGAVPHRHGAGARPGELRLGDRAQCRGRDGGREAHPRSHRPMVHLPAHLGAGRRTRDRAERRNAARRSVKIGIVSQSYYPRFGGVTEHVHHTAEELRRRAHDVRIITSRFRSDHPDPEYVDRVGYNVLIPFNRAFTDFPVRLTLKQELRQLFARHDFDVVHTHCPISPSLPILAIQAASCPQVGTFHSAGTAGVLQDTFRNFLTKVVDKLDVRIAVSKTAADTAQRCFPGTYHVIPNGVDIERFAPTVPAFDEWRSPDHVNLLFVGRLDPRKGVQLLIEV